MMEKDARSSGRTRKRDSDLAGSLEQGDDGMPLLPPWKNMIAFLVTNGVVISKLSEQETNDLSKLTKKTTFKTSGKTFRKPVWELKTRDNLRDDSNFRKRELPSYAQRTRNSS